MNKVFLAALMTGALCFFGTNCGGAKVQRSQTQEPKTATEPAALAPMATLTSEQPSSSFPVDAAVLANGPGIVEVAVTRVVNPSRAAVNVFVYLASTSKGMSGPEKVLIGNFSLSPTDQPATFLLNPAAAVDELCGDKPSPDVEARLVFELKRLDEKVGGTPVEVTISPQWRSREK